MASDETRKIWNLGEDRAPEVLELFRQSWWAGNRDLALTKKVLAGSDLTLGIVRDADNRLIGFARVVTDWVFKATIYDVLVEKHHQGMGLGKKLLRALFQHEELSGVEHFELYCKEEMIPFYSQYGFENIVPGV